ncbi:MAG: hypothetical protein M1292_00690 [Bacteroidetes bacterium]|nr:hypothetical protein [Bacteroidota bacterium]
MDNQLVKVITESKVEQPTAIFLQNSFLPFYEKLTEWTKKANALVVTDVTQTREMKMAREARLALRDIRVDADKKRKALKEDSTRYGKAVQNVYNLIENLIVPAEKHLEAQEKFVELQEAARKLKLALERETELKPYKEFVTSDVFNELGEYSDQEYSVVLENCKQALEDQIAEEAQAELNRIEAEKTKVARQEKMFELGLKWNGSEFSYKDINFHWTDLICMAKEEFESAYEGAKIRKEQLDLEDQQALARTTERKGQTPVEKPIIIWTDPYPVNQVIPLSRRYTATVVTPHPFHCFYCGSRLSEIGLGGLECADCLTVFIPSLDQDGNQCLTSQK